MKDDTVYLSHIFECIQRIEEFTSPGREQFLVSRLHQDAVIRNLQTMSEATQRLSDSVRASQPHIPWARIAGFRNVLVHNYLGIDVRHIWTIIESDIPALKQAVIAMLKPA